MTIRTSFVERFGEEDALRVEEAADSHIANGGMHAGDSRGDDPFKYQVLVCIAFDCLTRWRAHHGISASYRDIHEWALECADLRSFNGDIPDHLALAAGAYTPWINWEIREWDEQAEKWHKRNERYATMTEAEALAEDIVAMEVIRATVEGAITFEKNEEGPL